MLLILFKNIKRKLKLILLNFQFKGLSTQQIFTKIYKNSSWNKKSLEFNSGPGSHNKELVIPFLEFVNCFIINKNIKTIVDLGCGDFNIGKNIYENTNQYYAIDIVPDLIDHNKKLFKNSKIKFECNDFINDHIPEADCVILRQVLQCDRYGLYFEKNKESVSDLINFSDKNEDDILNFKKNSKKALRIKYDWDHITVQYISVFKSL